MRIVYIYRTHRVGGFSIENLFHTVVRELQSFEVTIIEYETGPRRRFLADLWALWRLQADVYHVTGDVNYFVPFLPPAKTVLTVHDIGHYIYGLSGVSKLIYGWLWLILPMRFAAKVTAVSISTQAQVTEHFREFCGRLEIIENCYDQMYRPIPKLFNASCPRILQVGTKPYKNVPRLISALRGIPCHLVLIGQVSSEIAAALAENGVTYETHVDISQHELLQQYVAADIVTFVSIGEGFGMPIIESQAIARPIITSSVRPMCDVAGDGACLADPMDPRTIRVGVLRLINDDCYRNEIIASGLRNVERYSPKRIAQRYMRLYGTI